MKKGSRNVVKVYKHLKFIKMWELDLKKSFVFILDNDDVNDI